VLSWPANKPPAAPRAHRRCPLGRRQVRERGKERNCIERRVQDLARAQGRDRPIRRRDPRVLECRRWRTRELERHLHKVDRVPVRQEPRPRDVLDIVRKILPEFQPQHFEIAVDPFA
jgi:hypothetical protein